MVKVHIYENSDDRYFDDTYKAWWSNFLDYLYTESKQWPDDVNPALESYNAVYTNGYVAFQSEEDYAWFLLRWA